MNKRIVYAIVGVLILIKSVWSVDLAIVASKNFPVEKLSAADVRDIFLGEKTIISGKKLSKIDYHDAGEIRKTFLKKILGISKDGFQTYWIKKIFQDGGTPPSIFDDLANVAKRVVADDATISFMPSAEAKNNSAIRILLTVSSTK